MTEERIEAFHRQSINLLERIAATLEIVAGRFRSELGGGVPVADAAKHLKLNPRTLILKLKAKELPGYRIGRRWYVQMDDLRDRIILHKGGAR